MGFADDPRFRRAFVAGSAVLALGIIMLLVVLGIAATREATSRAERQVQEAPRETVIPDDGTLKPDVDRTQSFRDIHDDDHDCSTCHVPRHTAITPCTDCHPDTSSGWVTQHPYFSNCESCHSRPSGHYQGTCTTCHKTTGNFYEAAYTHTAGSRCSRCHAPPHEKKVGACSTCHPRTGDSWAFVHTAAGGCDDCHDSPKNHYGNGCSDCHAPPIVKSASWRLGCNASECHTRITSVSHVPVAANDVCVECHDQGSLADIHLGAVVSISGAKQRSCLVCHSPAAPTISRNCRRCHDDKFNTDGSADLGHAFDEVTHMADPPSEHINVSGTDLGEYQCSLCHDYRIGQEHEKATSSSAGVGCQNCHPTPRTTFAGWDKSCAQGGCHELATGEEKHLLIDAAHEVSIDMQASCQQDCHSGSTAEIHLDASTTVDGVVVMGCLVCHGEGIPAPAECIECHATRHEGADHSATRDSCGLAGCHDGGAPDELHATCMQCHSVTPLPSSTMCLECHTATGPHEPYAANHVGNVSGSIRSNMIPGCGGVPNPGRANYVGLCHDVSNTMKLHENVHSRSDGCPQCHGSGVTLSNRCVDCHIRRTGDPVKADVPSGNAVHHDNNKYLKDPADIVEGSYARSGAPGGYNSALVNYDCQFCHWGFFYGSKATIPERRSPYSGDSMWYAGLRTGAGGVSTDTTMQIPGTFVATADMVLEYMVNYQGRVTDYGYTEISTDGGVTWATVPGNITSVAPVSATHLGNGISGNSITWTQATFSLAAYDGQTISLRLRYKTPYQSVAPGFGYAVDDIELGDGTGSLFSDGAEDIDSGMITANWLRTGIFPPAYAPDDPNNAP